MKKLFIQILCLIICAAFVITAGCTDSKVSDEVAQVSSPDTAVFDPYADKNDDKVPEELTEKQEGTDYGTIDSDVEYYSNTAKDYKKCNVLLPAGYSKNKKYPVLYAIHGWGGDYTGLIHQDSFLQILYGNMLKQELAVPMIIVSVDMYTGIAFDKEKISEEEMRHCYDKVIYDIKDDLMPMIESRYSVLTGRNNTAVAGQSQGGTESLATGFIHQDIIGFIGSFAPATGVIPTEYYKNTYWNIPILDDFEIEDAETEPKYIYLSVGSDDPWDIDCTLYYGKVMTDNGIKNQTDFVEGHGHDAAFWQLCYYNFMKKIFRS